LASRDNKGRFLPGCGREPYDNRDRVRTVVLCVRVTGDLADRAYTAAARRNTTLSELMRGYLLQLSSDLS
jgi:hypothetical protein